MCLTKTHLRESVNLKEEEYAYTMVCKGRSQQSKKGGGNAVLVRKTITVGWDVLIVGNCGMNEDIMTLKLEYDDVNKRKHLCMLCDCEGQGAQAKNRRKYDTVKNFENLYCSKKVLEVGDIQGPRQRGGR